MFRKFSYTWSVAGACWKVLRAEPGLILFPLISAVSVLLVMASFAAPVLIFTSRHPASPSASAPPAVAETVVRYLYLFVFYFCNYFVITFFNGALMICAIGRLRGEQPTLGYGLKHAFKRIRLIAGWALLSATVGVILRAISERVPFVGRIVISLLGLAWAVASYLAVPLLVAEDVGPLTALKRSSAMLRKTWGERLIGSAGFSIVSLLLALPAISLGIGGVMLAIYSRPAQQVPILIATGALFVLYIILEALVITTLQAIFQAAMYLYASNPEQLSGHARQGQGFPVILLADAMRVKA